MANQGASSSSAPFTKSWKYHVFLSFRGEDTRDNFTSHLYSALRQQGINTFMDDDELRRGEEISNALLTAIEDSKISVVVFSEHYASSKWCLDELVKILDCKESNQQLVIPVFYKVDPSDVRNQTGSFGNALARLESKYKDNMDKVNRWKAALSQAGKLAGFPLPDEKPLKRSEAVFIQEIIEEISVHVIDRTYLKVAEYPVGMQAQVQVMNKLLDLGGNDVRMVGVWGTGGIGKTTVATEVYNSIAHEFEGSCFLANVRESSTSHEGLAKLQKTLLSAILRGKNLEVPNVHIGATMIQERLSCRKVLLVLDDVNNMEQLYKLAGACDWFGAGSRIIITTRDKQLLTAHGVNLIQEVKKLDDDEAMELFSWHAFKRRGPPLGDYAELTKRAIRYAQGLPLALKVLGSCLCGGTIEKWQAALDGFKSTEIQDVLKISYDALDYSVQQLFLDLACFFKGKSRRYAIEALEACDRNPRYGIDVLIEKALISVEVYDYIQMHDLLEEMGKDIVHQESPTEPGERSRLWRYEDIEDVLTNDTGTNKITGIMLNSPQINDEIFLDVDCFSKMKNLKIFINYNVCLSGDYLPNTLRVLDWYGCPLQSFPPNFRPKKLVVFNMPYNRIKQPERLLKHFTKLTSLNLHGSQFLTAIPDLSASPNIKSLDASECTSLVEVHPSVGYLWKLEKLNLSDCHELTKFPDKVWLKSLKSFLLPNCKKLESFPEIVDKMESIYELDLHETGIKELPASIGNLTALRILKLQGCANLANLPQSIYGLQNLGFISLNECPKLVTLPNNLNSQVLWSAKSLPQIFVVGEFRMQQCNVSDMNSLENFCCWLNFENVDLSKSNFVSLPVCISKFVNLRMLFLSGCRKLVEIAVQLPASIKMIYMDGCISLENVVQLPTSIESINMADCISLERFSTVSKILEDGDMQHIVGMDLASFSMQESNLSYINSLENFCCLRSIDLSKSNFVSLPVCISKFVKLQDLNLSGCKKLVEIVVQLPASLQWINLADCISLERFSTLSKILEDGDTQHIDVGEMNLSNCHRLCNNIGLDAAKMANILLNNQAAVKMFNRIILPGSEVPEWFSYRKDVGVLLTDEKAIDLFDFRIEIEIPIEDEFDEFDEFDELKLVVCIVFELVDEIEIGIPIEDKFHKRRELWLLIDGNEYKIHFLKPEPETDHVALFCIPLERYIHYLKSEPETEYTKPKGDNDGDDQLKPSIGRIITVSCRGGRGLLVKSFGAQLSRFSMPKHGFRFWLMPKDGDDGKMMEMKMNLDDDDDLGDDGKNDENEEEDENELEDENDDDVGDEVRP